MSNEATRTYPMLLDFVRKEYISKHLLRVTLTGDALIGFPEDKNGMHIKVFFPNKESGILQLPHLEEGTVVWPEQKPIPRAYTVRKYRADVNEIDIDFVVHGSDTPGSGWAFTAQEGAQIGLVGPAGPDPLMAPADWHIMAGDLTALPAMSAILEALPFDSLGYVFIEIDDAADKHAILCPTGFTIRWLVRKPGDDHNLLRDAIAEITLPDGVPSLSAFIAGENQSVLACRKILKDAYKLSRKNMYAIPYWKRGEDEETYHAERHEVMDEEY